MGCVVVKEASVVALEHFGKYERMLEPGIHFFNPFKYGTTDPLSLKLQSTDFKLETITSESLSVIIHIAVQYRIDTGDLKPLESVIVDPNDEIDENADCLKKDKVISMTKDQRLYKAYYTIERPLHQMEQHIDSYFRTYAAKHTLKEMLQEQNVMSDSLCKILNTEMNPFGYLIFRCMVTDIDPPPEIKRTMNSVLTSQNTRQAMINEAEGKKAAAILEAEGLRSVKQLEGEGVSLQRRAIADGLHETMKSFGQDTDGMDPNTISSIILTMQYMDTINHATQNGNNSFILSSNPLGAVTMEEQLKTSFLSTRPIK